jgi:hypothetical protein
MKAADQYRSSEFRLNHSDTDPRIKILPEDNAIDARPEIASKIFSKCELLHTSRPIGRLR